MDWVDFCKLIARYHSGVEVHRDTVLFDLGLNMTSIDFAELVFELEEITGRDIDLDSLDESIRTAGQLYDRIFGA